MGEGRGGERVVKAMIEELESLGYVVLRAKSYRQAQERQRVAEALRQNEAENAESTRQWALRADAFAARPSPLEDR